MTTITIKKGLEELRRHSYDNYKELMEELAELHDFKIIWQMGDDEIPESVLKSLEEHEKNPDQKLYNL